MMVVLVTALVGGCVDDADETPFSESEARVQCGRICAGRRVCAPAMDEAACVQTCLAPRQQIRAEALLAYADCVTTSGCPLDEAACLREVPALSAHTQLEAACRLRQVGCGASAAAASQACGVEGTGPAAWVRFLVPEQLPALEECLQQGCGQIGACYADVLRSAGFDLD